MTSASPLLKTLLIYSICLPLAVFLGYLIASPDPTRDYSVWIGIALVISVLVLPLLLKWHREILIASWSGCIGLYFMPGRPELWLAMMWVSFTIALVQSILSPSLKFISVRSITAPLMFLAAVTLVTAKLTGGVGIGAFGSETMGGKKYIYILTSILGYFALVSRPIPPKRAYIYTALFFLGALTFIVNDVAARIGSSAVYLYWFFPLGVESLHVLRDETGEGYITRLGNVGVAATACYYTLLVWYGIRGIFNTAHKRRIITLIALGFLALASGFRSNLIHFAMAFAILFWLEGLIRSRLTAVFLAMFVLGGALIIGFSNRLPLSFQRTISFLPVEVDPVAKESAQVSSKWRTDMWKSVIPQIPHYLLLGKGYSLTEEEMQKPIAEGYKNPMDENAMGAANAGDFHNGPLSVIIIFGVWGVAGWLWFLLASFRVFRQNYLYGNPELKLLNRGLFAIFLARAIFFFTVFGSFYSDLTFFVGLVGISIAVNAGVANPAPARQMNLPIREPRRRLTSGQAVSVPT
jgi:hypothetical protein